MEEKSDKIVNENNNLTKYKALKIILLVFFILLIVMLSIKFIPYFKLLVSNEGREILKNKITNAGPFGVFIILTVMFLKIFLIFIPGEPIELLAGICYGTYKGLLVICIGALINSTIIMFLVRKLGRSFLYTFVNKEKIEKLENSSFLKKKNLEFILILLFAVPGTPKDLLTYIGAFLPINPVKFIIISTIARIPTIISSTVAGDKLVDGNLIFVIAIYLITFIISIFGVYFFNKNDVKTN